MACALPPPDGGGKRGIRHRMVSYPPLNSPSSSFKPRLPAVARLNAMSPQGRLVLQGYTLDGSGAFRSGTPPPCTGWPRTVMRGGLRKVNSGPDSVSKSARRTEPSPRIPRFAARPKGVAVQRKVRGVKRGQETIHGVLSPFVPAGEHRHLRRQTAALPRRRRRILTTLTLSINPPPAARRFTRSRNSRFSYKTNRLSPSSMVYYS